MFTLEDESLLEEFERAEQNDPSPSKVIDSTRMIYGTRKLGLPKGRKWGRPVLCDFGEARIVLFEMPWDSSVDVWNVAVLIWDIFENRHLFRALDEDGNSSATHHVAEMIAYMGLPPREYATRSKVMQNVFDGQCRWRGAGGVSIPSVALEDRATSLQGEAKAEFLAFIRSMLGWEPEKRKSASALLRDPFMADALGASGQS